MYISGVSCSLISEVETDLDMFSKFFDLQNVRNPRKISRDLSAARGKENTFLFTNFEGNNILVDIIPFSNNVKMELLKNDSISKLMEIKRGKLANFEETLVGTAILPRP